MIKSKNLLPAAIYVRRSCARSSESSCEDQKNNCLHRMREMGYYLACEQAIFEDDIESGAIFYTRPKMKEIIDLLRCPRPLSPKPYNAIFIDDISRVARNLAFSLLFVQGLRFHGIALYDARGQEYTSETGYYYMLLLGLGAEIERDSLSRRTSRGMHAAAKRMSLSARIYGYSPMSTNTTVMDEPI